MYTNKVFRKQVVENIKDPLVKSFWVDEFATYTDRYTQEATPAIQNKVGQFTSNPLVRNIVGQPNSSFDMREIMDGKKIFIANLSKGRIGETNADLLGSMLTTKIYLSALSRADLSAPQQAKLPPFFFYVDEFQSIANESFADILSEARKYKLSLTIAHQYIEQMEENVRNAVFGNVGTIVTFRVGPFDAEVLETIFKPQFVAEDLVNLGLYQIYLTLMIDGVGSKPFSALTLSPIGLPHISYKDQTLIHSRKTYGRSRTDVEKAIGVRTAKAPEQEKPPARQERQQRPQRRETPPDRREQRERPLQRKPRHETPKEITPDELRAKMTKKFQGNTPQQKAERPPEPSGERRAGLKSALDEVLREAVPGQKGVSKEDAKRQNEIPEEELRKLLDVDEA